MKKEDYYNRPRGCERTMIFIVAVFFAILLLFSCENNDWSEDCCWICKIKVTDYKPQPGIDEVSTTIKFADSVYCNCTDEFIKNWEVTNSDTLYINGIRREIIAKCKQ